MWAAPAITTLGTAAGATGSCVKGGSVFKFVAAGSTPGTGASLTGPLVSGAYALAVVQGNVDYVGPGTGFVAGYTSVKTVDLTGDGSVTVTELTGATLLLGNYVVELDVYGSTLFPVPAGPSGNPNNQIEVKIGGTTLIGPVSPPDGPGTLTPAERHGYGYLRPLDPHPHEPGRLPGPVPVAARGVRRFLPVRAAQWSVATHGS